MRFELQIPPANRNGPYLAYASKFRMPHNSTVTISVSQPSCVSGNSLHPPLCMAVDIWQCPRSSVSRSSLCSLHGPSTSLSVPMALPPLSLLPAALPCEGPALVALPCMSMFMSVSLCISLPAWPLLLSLSALPCCPSLRMSEPQLPASPFWLPLPSSPPSPPPLWVYLPSPGQLLFSLLVGAFFPLLSWAGGWVAGRPPSLVAAPSCFVLRRWAALSGCAARRRRVHLHFH